MQEIHRFLFSYFSPVIIHSEFIDVQFFMELKQIFFMDYLR